MANSDYVNVGTGPMCPSAELQSAMGYLDTTLTYKNLEAIEGTNDIDNGAAILVDDEIMAIVSQAGNVLTVLRGCCDTVPAQHAMNAVVWFFESSTGSDGREYVGGETVSVKLLPATPTGAAVPIEASPPQAVTFNWRFARPYPPGNLKVDGQPWFEPTDVLDSSHPQLSLTWSHRDRLLQGDVLVGHGEASIGPEAGTTYQLEAYKANGELRRTVQLPLAAGGAYAWWQAVADVQPDPGGATPAFGYLLLSAKRDGLTSYQKYRIEFSATGGFVLVPEVQLARSVKDIQDLAGYYHGIDAPFEVAEANNKQLHRFDPTTGSLIESTPTDMLGAALKQMTRTGVSLIVLSRRVGTQHFLHAFGSGPLSSPTIVVDFNVTGWTSANGVGWADNKLWLIHATGLLRKLDWTNLASIGTFDLSGSGAEFDRMHVVGSRVLLVANGTTPKVIEFDAVSESMIQTYTTGTATEILDAYITSTVALVRTEVDVRVFSRATGNLISVQALESNGGGVYFVSMNAYVLCVGDPSSLLFQDDGTIIAGFDTPQAVVASEDPLDVSRAFFNFPNTPTTPTSYITKAMRLQT